MDYEKIRCQSCGMPLSEDLFGTNKNGSLNEEYCKYCFKGGKFTDPTIKVREMIEKSVEKMVKELGISEDEARVLAQTRIPKLKRWRKL